MRRRPRRYKTRPPRGVRWMHFRQRLRHVLGFGRQRHSPAPVTELDDVILESAHADGQRILESARDRAVEIEATAVERALSLSSEADAIVAEARANAAEILGDAEKVARDYLVALDSLLG